MENIHQIKTINMALNKEKDKWLFELSKISAAIIKKESLISKMLMYQKEYDRKDKLEMSKSNPMLHKNFDMFYKKMLDALFKSESELEALNRSKNIIVDKIANVDQKIKTMEIFQERIQLNEASAKERLEQLLMSDLSLRKYLGGEND